MPEDSIGTADLSKQIRWSYFAAGILQERKDQSGQLVTNNHDVESP